jgi:hypothetical protein
MLAAAFLFKSFTIASPGVFFIVGDFPWGVGFFKSSCSWFFNSF